MFRRLFRFALLLSFVILIVSSAGAGVNSNRDRNLTVMTRNLDTGTDFGLILSASSPDAVPPAVTATFLEVLQSNMPGRAELVAAEIQGLKPDLIGLQEVSKLLVGKPFGLDGFNDPSNAAKTVLIDQLQLLMRALDRRGLHYKALAVQSNADLTLPAALSPTLFFNVRLIDYDVVLVRSDLSVSEMKIEKVTAQHFTTTLVFPSLGEVPRGWIAVDAKFRGQSYRFVTTHLETFDPPIQIGQTLELINGPLVTDRPVILAGDLNSDANHPDDPAAPAVSYLISAGMRDIWHELHPADAGNTWPLHDEDAFTYPQKPFQRIDMVLMRGAGIAAIDDSRFGLTPSVTGLWPSDHAGVVASFKLLP